MKGNRDFKFQEKSYTTSESYADFIPEDFVEIQSNSWNNKDYEETDIEMKRKENCHTQSSKNGIKRCRTISNGKEIGKNQNKITSVVWSC